MANFVAVAEEFMQRDPMGANFLAELLGRHVPRFGKVIFAFQDGKIVHACKEESFRPSLTTVGK
jgi:hypothetical protein